MHRKKKYGGSTFTDLSTLFMVDYREQIFYSFYWTDPSCSQESRMLLSSGLFVSDGTDCHRHRWLGSYNRRNQKSHKIFVTDQMGCWFKSGDQYCFQRIKQSWKPTTRFRAKLIWCTNTVIKCQISLNLKREFQNMCG